MNDSVRAARHAGPGMRTGIVAVVVIVLLVAMGLDTAIVSMDSGNGVDSGEFSPETYGAEQFPKTRAAVEKQAVDAATLASAIAEDKDAAVEKYGVPAGTGPEMSVKFTGVVGEGDFGVYAVKVDGLPDGLTIRVQTGPAINGTDLRDATGTIKFGQFTNQIEYQNAGAAINNAMKKDVLSKIDNEKLTGKTISVVGVFKLINPENWLVTPVALSVQ